MTPTETITILRRYNEWRRGCDIEHPPTVGKAIDTAIEIIERLEAAEKERDSTMRLADSLALALNTSNHERDALRAKIEAMERQEPIAWTTELALRHGASALGFDACVTNLWSEKGVPLYALPRAQPAPSVPVDVIADYLVSISAHLARRDDAKAQAEIGELLKMIAKAPKPEGE